MILLWACGQSGAPVLKEKNISPILLITSPQTMLPDKLEASEACLESTLAMCFCTEITKLDFVQRAPWELSVPVGSMPFAKESPSTLGQRIVSHLCSVGPLEVLWEPSAGDRVKRQAEKKGQCHLLVAHKQRPPGDGQRWDSEDGNLASRAGVRNPSPTSLDPLCFPAFICGVDWDAIENLKTLFWPSINNKNRKWFSVRIFFF